jgi:multimeric flavodoxin WrbA
MKILAIHGSPRGTESQTLRLARAVLRGAEERGAEIELIDVCTLDIQYCNGCGVCYSQGECVLDDDFALLFQKMLEADGIVLSSPVYINQVTAQLKAVLDRLADAIHCQMFTGKYGCAVATAGGSGADEVVDYLNSVLQILGATTVGGVGVVIAGNPDAVSGGEEKARERGRDLWDAIHSQRTYPDQEEIHAGMKERMKYLVSAHKDDWDHEYRYWQEMGWIEE